MPTSTATMTFSAATKVSKLPVSARKSNSSQSTVATLRSLYPRAVRAFLQRDVTLTYSLLLSAFSNLQPPLSSSVDPLSSLRRKWDILRITLEATLYVSVPHKETLPPALHSALLLSPTSLIEIMHARSLQLFTPANRGKPTGEFLPSQILVALVLASVKLDCVHVGREMIENWLSLRNHSYENNTDVNETQAKEDAQGYEKVLEMYSLHVLPRLKDWHSAREFLRYESELSQDTRMYLVQSLQVLHAQHLHMEEVRERQRSINNSPSSSRTPTPRPLNGRIPSPSPSVASTSTTSTHTVVPFTSRPHDISSSFTSLTPTPRVLSPTQPRQYLSTVTAHRQSRSATPLPTPPSAPQMPVSSISAPSFLTLLKTSLLPHLTKSKLTFLIVMFLVPVVSFVFRLRRRRLRLLPGGGAALVISHPRSNAAEETRRRLKAGWWPDIRKAITDTIQMATGGLA